MISEELDQESQDQIKSLLDSSDNGFFTHYFSQESQDQLKSLKTANYIFTLDSSWARGRKELIMVSLLLSEEEPDYVMYEKILSEFTKKIQKYPFIYKAFYINSAPPEEKEEVMKNLEILKQELSIVYKILSVKKIETEGQLISFSRLKEQKSINLSSNIIEKLNNLTPEKKNCFIVSRTQGSIIKIDMIPVATEKIIRLVIIFGEHLQIPVLYQIGQKISKYESKTTLVFTSGVCQEINRCLYELYLDTDMNTLNTMIEEIYTIESILSIEVKLINLT